MKKYIAVFIMFVAIACSNDEVNLGGEVNYTIIRVNDTTIEAVTLNGIAFETFTLIQ
jgi:hypothetical protein